MNTTLDDISAVIGWSPTMRIVAVFRNRNLYVPAEVKDGQQLVELIGMPAAKRLSAEWPGKCLAIPSLFVYERELLRDRIKRLRAANISAREVADILDISPRRVKQIEAELPTAMLLAPDASVVEVTEGEGVLEDEAGPSQVVTLAIAGMVGSALPRG